MKLFKFLLMLAAFACTSCAVVHAEPVQCELPVTEPQKENLSTAATQWTNLLITPLAKPQVFESLNGERFLVYELLLSNFSNNTIKLRGMDVRHGDDTSIVIKPIEESELRKVTIQPAHGSDALQFGPGSVGVCFINIAMSKADPVPSSLTHLVVYDQNPPGGKSEFVEVRAGRVEVETAPPVVIGAPLTGGPWVVYGGFDSTVRHRRALFFVDNQIRCAQRYAIDWIKLDAKNRSMSDGTGLQSSPSYDQPVLAVADAVVAGVTDRFPDQPLGKPSGDRRFPAGNSVTLKLASGQYVYYAHLKLGSIKVKEGDQVKKGQQIGVIGNSGNTATPHLHMQITDGPGPFGSNSLPYVFEQFSYKGKVADLQKFEKDELSHVSHTLIPLTPETVVKKALPGEGTVLSF